MSRPKNTDAAPPAEPTQQAGIGDMMQDVTHTLPARLAMAPLPPDGPEFDAWLRGHLNRMHDRVLVEPIPERFLRLLDGLSGSPPG